ncbi:ephrin-B3, partial [Corvus hawaiiensis]|uniref:ephrin-B3 n=1 Tax=Corvus hawaiiensis TaxID=134902 RepID=UPI002018C2B3
HGAGDDVTSDVTPSPPPPPPPAATSDGTPEGLENRQGGACLTRAMRVTLRVGQRPGAERAAGPGRTDSANQTSPPGPGPPPARGGAVLGGAGSSPDLEPKSSILGSRILIFWGKKVIFSARCLFSDTPSLPSRKLNPHFGGKSAIPAPETRSKLRNFLTKTPNSSKNPEFPHSNPKFSVTGIRLTSPWEGGGEGRGHPRGAGVTHAVSPRGDGDAAPALAGPAAPGAHAGTGEGPAGTAGTGPPVAWRGVGGTRGVGRAEPEPEGSDDWLPGERRAVIGRFLESVAGSVPVPAP